MSSRHCNPTRLFTPFIHRSPRYYVLIPDDAGVAPDGLRYAVVQEVSLTLIASDGLTLPVDLDLDLDRDPPTSSAVFVQ